MGRPAPCSVPARRATQWNREALRALLGLKLAVLRSNLAAGPPLQRQGRVDNLLGNAAHRGGIEQAYVVIDSALRAVQLGL